MNPTSASKVTGFSLLSPSVVSRDQDSAEANAAYHSSISMIRRAGLAAELPQKAISTAVLMFLRYFAVNDICDASAEHSVGDVCRVCLLSASKVEETPLRLRDVQNVTRKVAQPESEALSPNTAMWQRWKARLLALETHVLSELHFEFNMVSPHHFIVHQCHALAVAPNVCRLAWALLNDCLFARRIMLCFEPHHIAAAALFVAVEFWAQCERVPHAHSNAGSPRYDRHRDAHRKRGLGAAKEAKWWRRFDVDDAVLREIASLIMDLCESEFVSFAPPKAPRASRAPSD